MIYKYFIFDLRIYKFIDGINNIITTDKNVKVKIVNYYLVLTILIW